MELANNITSSAGFREKFESKLTRYEQHQGWFLLLMSWFIVKYNFMFVLCIVFRVIMLLTHNLVLFLSQRKPWITEFCWLIATTNIIYLI